MTKSDFRVNQSLAADLMRVEESLISNQKLLVKSFNDVKSRIPEINNDISNVIQFRDTITGFTTSIQNTIDNLENDMISLEGIDLFEFKNSPDDLILTLRKSNENVKNLEEKIEENLKLVTKAKGKNGLFQEEINTANKVVHELLNSSQESLDIIENSVKLLLDEIKNFKAHSKDLLQHKIL